MRETSARRVVITGLGAVTPNGSGRQAFWDASCKGISGIRPIERFSVSDLPIQVAGTVPDFLPEAYLDRKLVKRTDRVTHFVFAAVAEALQDARLQLATEDPTRVGAVIANTVGGVDYVLEQMEALYVRGPRAMSVYTAIAWLPVANVGQIAVQHGIQGYSKTPVNDTIGGLDALGLAYQAIRRGAADLILAGGSEALLQPCVLLVMAHGEQCVNGSDPCAYRPFDRRASGLLLAEGAGICVLEEYEHARRRDAPIYGEIVGYAQTHSAHAYLAPTTIPERHYARAFQLALSEGGLQPSEIAYVNLDGRALPAWDAAEAAALRQVFGSELDRLPVSVPRTLLGHSYAAAGALDTISTLLTLKHRLVPPTLNCEELDPAYGLHGLVRDEARALEGGTRAALVAGRGNGGANAVLALQGPDPMEA